MDRLRRQIPLMLKRTFVELNIFKGDWTGSNDQSQIRYQRMATRLYIVLVALGLISFTCYLFLTQQKYVETVKYPNPTEFSRLQSLYSSSLQCGCSNISVPYNVFLTIEPHYHQICESDLVSKSWLDCLSLGLELSITLRAVHAEKLDFRFTDASHFFLLKMLCNQANQTIMNSLRQFLDQTFVTTQVISENLFELQATELIKNWKLITTKNFLRTLDLIRVTEHGNHLAAADSNSQFDVRKMPNKSLLNSWVYYDQCNSMLSRSCHSPINVYEFQSEIGSPLFHIPDFFMGCFRLEGLLNSTLEYFYSQTGMNALVKAMERCTWANYTALNATRNSPNESIDSVVSRLFVDEWSPNNG